MTGETILEAGSKYLGVPYVWGGEDRRGMDCSGFVYRTLRDVGFSISRLTAQMYYNTLGDHITLDKALPGDLLFFGTSKNHITHIAFNMDGTNMLESGGGGSSNGYSNPGEGVRIRKIRNDLVGVNRIVDGRTTSSGYTFNTSLVKKGSKGIDVLLLQEILKARGYYGGELDSDFGEGLENALKYYQGLRIAMGADMGCGKIADGICGAKTWSDLLAT